MVDDIMNVVRFEFVQDRHNDSSIGNSCQKSNRPMGTVSSADCYLISRLDSCAFQDDVKLGDFTRYVFILKGDSFIVS